MTKGLFISDSPKSPTGFAGQTKHVYDHVLEKMKHDAEYLGWQTIPQQPAMYKGKKVLSVKHENDMFGKEAIQEYLTNEDYDYVWSLGDTWLVNTIPKNENRPLWIGYFPIDGHPLNQEQINTLSQMDVRVAMAKYGAKLVLETGLSCEYIPHQVDRSIFSPVDNGTKGALRKEHFPKLKSSDILIGSFARLNPRKHHMRLFQAFAKLLAETGRDDIYLYLHADPMDVMYNTHLNAHDYLIVELINTLGIEDKLIFPPAPYSHTVGLPKETYVDLMRCMDFHVLPTGGEGFGVPTVEMMSLGIPTIATDYTTSREFIAHENVEDIDAEDVHFARQRGILVPYEKLYLERAGVHKAWIDIELFKNAMLKYINEPTLLKRHKRNCIKYAENYDSAIVNKKWTKLFRSIPKVTIQK